MDSHLKRGSEFSDDISAYDLICISFSDTSPSTSPVLITSPFVKVTVPRSGSTSEIV